jgi:hypothetical protein
MPVKKTKKPRARRAPAKKKGLKQKQKQRQEQKVNVSVSAGGSGGGGTQFIPMPSSAPVFDYAQLANLIRPANVVDVPIRAQANPEPLPAREAEAPSLAEEIPSAKARKVRSDAGKSRKASSSSAQTYFEEPESGMESESYAQAAFQRVKEAKARSGAFIE